jgi:ribonuclease HII
MPAKMRVTYSLGDTIEMGLDEAGRGCFWGPLFAGAVIWPPEDCWTDEHREIVPLINDSKKMSEKKRHYVAGAIRELAVDWGVGSVQPSEIDEKGITWANREAFRRAKDACSTGLEPELLLIDGVLGLPDDVPYECIPGGDGLFVPIAAASILAKTGRDTWVTGWCTQTDANKEISARYDLLSNKGYGTAKHREGLKNFGYHSMHRELFIRNWI